MTPIEMLEAYSSDHPETIAELLEWPYRRIKAALEAWTRRRLVEEWNQRKLMHMAAIHANTNYDSKEVNKQEVLDEADKFYENIKQEIMMSQAEREAIDKAFNDSPLIRASRRSIARATAHVNPVNMPGADSIRRLPER